MLQNRTRIVICFLFFSFYYFLFSKILFLPPLSRGTLEQGPSQAIALSTPTA
jgi:hypothetical protein